jgi:GMP synthase-like glutamine amidotransferase
VLGAKVFLNKYREVGWHDVILTPEGKNSFLFRNIQEKFMTFHWHSDHFSLPSGCTQLAFSKATENQAFVCKNRPIIGVQFHPEYTLAMAKDLSIRKGDDLIPDRFVSGKETMLAQAEKIPETYWLMASLLDNIEREFG